MRIPKLFYAGMEHYRRIVGAWLDRYHVAREHGVLKGVTATEKMYVPGFVDD
jgi:hypothetical protein